MLENCTYDVIVYLIILYEVIWPAPPPPNNPMALVYFYVILLLIIPRSVFVFI